MSFMNIKNRLLRKLAEGKLIEWKPEYYTFEESKYIDWKNEQFEKLEMGEDIEPPWFVYNQTMSQGIYNFTLSPWEMRNDYWLLEVWLPFWRKLGEEKRQVYKTKFNMTDECYETVTYWTKNRINENKTEKKEKN
jgi:hypothetical protein